MTGVARSPAHRCHPAIAYSRLKSASADVMEQNGGTVRAASRTRGSDETLRKAMRHEYPDNWLGIDQVADLEVRAGRPFVTAELAELAGYILIPSPEQMRGEGLEQRSIKEAAEAITAISAAMATKNKVERHEVPHVRREVREAIIALFAYDTALERTFPDLMPETTGGEGD
ncbi:hypothetical protein [Maricaulis maris]|uniref:Uncharacterized protein n=1 Tax=Maricaulis maris TaxID=74318 RepID=A0A495D3A9_9PROT|nr:hypothetical protein [Maricaulis maris]RKQ95450.1 hypothetical protein C7435_2552 [Maricaulis maris]